jgi:hypothetical protein
VNQPVIPEEERLDGPGALHGTRQTRSPGAESDGARGDECAAEQGQARQTPQRGGRIVVRRRVALRLDLADAAGVA